MNQAVIHLLKHCIDNEIGNIIYGNAPILIRPTLSDFEDTRVTQNFNYIPYRKFTRKLHNKAELFGIAVTEVDEDFTSIICYKCGYKDLRNRLQRGILHCRKCKKKIHADINAAINIARQVSPGFRSSGCMIQPVRIRVID